MPHVPLGRGKYAIVDEIDLIWTATRSWHLSSCGHAMTYAEGSPRRRKVCLHTLIMEPAKGQCVVHDNGDKLDYRRSNLRVVSAAEAGSTNWQHRQNRSSQFKGVTRSHNGKRWIAQMSTVVDGKRKIVYVGSYTSEIEAAIEYKKAVRALEHGAEEAQQEP